MKPKPLSDLLKEISEHIGAIKNLCMDELTAMKYDFCHHAGVHLKRDNCVVTYFEYHIQNNMLWVSGHMVTAIRYYAYDDEWILATQSQDGEEMDEICAADIGIEEKIELVIFLKQELYRNDNSE